VEGESDPLLKAENGKGGLTDAVAPKAPVWKSNKDLDA
jgi:solute carrier family 35, member E3